MITKEKLKKIRVIDHNLTQEYAAELVGVSVRTWQRWESGESPINNGLFELFLIKCKSLKMEGKNGYLD